MPSMPSSDLRHGDAVLIVDVQNDFCPGGALPIPQGDQVLPALNSWLDAARAAKLRVYASRDWHPEGHLSFRAQGGPWPAHCLQDTPGAAFHPDLHLPPDVVKVSKGTRFDQDQVLGVRPDRPRHAAPSGWRHAPLGGRACRRRLCRGNGH